MLEFDGAASGYLVSVCFLGGSGFAAGVEGVLGGAGAGGTIHGTRDDTRKHTQTPNHGHNQPLHVMDITILYM